MQRTERLIFLDYLRLFAIGNVMAEHLFSQDLQQYAASTTGLLHTALQCLRFMIAEGVPGVVVFFLISGYIITHVLGRETCKTFLIRRAFRIYPAYVLALLLDCLTDSTRSLLDYVSSATFFQQALLVGDVFNTNHALGGVEWTLRIEMAFYLLMAAIKFTGSMHNLPHRLPGILLACTLLLTLLQKVLPISFDYICAYTPFLFLGAFVYLYEKKYIRTLLLFSYAVLVLVQYFYPLRMRDLNPDMLYFHNANALPAVVIFMAVWCCRARMSPARFIITASAMTYPLYLLHVQAYAYFLSQLAPQFTNTALLSLSACCALLLASYALHKIIEAPAIRMGRRIALTEKDFPCHYPPSSNR